MYMNNHDNSLISVIIPVYKVEKYLSKCVESIINQTYKNLEIILVNDGSPDNCGEICDEYAKKDSRIKVIHKENGGLSDARNAGIEIASGQYIAFVDSDDYIASNMYERMYETKKDIKNIRSNDISYCNIKKLVWKICFFKSRNPDIRIRIKHFCNTAADTVKFHTIKPAVLHVFRQHSKEMSCSHSWL